MLGDFLPLVIVKRTLSRIKRTHYLYRRCYSLQLVRHGSTCLKGDSFLLALSTGRGVVCFHSKDTGPFARVIQQWCMMT